MISTWTPLWSDIIASSVWSEPDHVRLLWITMLAMKDMDGFVGASVNGLARMANLTCEQVEEGLKVLQSPDPYSRTKDFEGRRIVVEEGGWRILNHQKMIDRIKRERKKTADRLRARELRVGKMPRPYLDAESAAELKGCNAG